MPGLHRLLRIGDVTADIAIADVDVDVGSQLPVLGSNRRGPTRRGNLGDLSQRHGASGGHGDQDIGGNGLGIFPEIARVAHVDAEALAAFYGGGDRLAAERGCNDVLNVLHHDAITRQSRTVRRHLKIVAADSPLGIG